VILIAYTSSLETLSLGSVVDRKMSFLPASYGSHKLYLLFL